jgi:hypothetical protein
MKWILTLLCFLCLHDPLVAKITGSHLRALIISDKAPRSMKNSYLHDAYRMKQMLQAIARYTKCPLQLQMCAGKKSSFRTLKKWLRSLPLSSKDIVFVYYAGKGCPQVGNNLWPSIKFPDRHGCFGRTYTEGEIASQISAKHPRLTLVFFDCYDQLIKIRRPSRSFSNRPRRSACPPATMGLFLESQGSVVACSALQGQPSFGIGTNMTSGGLFSAKLIHIFQNFRFGLTDWNSVCADLKDLHFDGGQTSQRPYCEVNVRIPPEDIVTNAKKPYR